MDLSKRKSSLQRFNLLARVRKLSIPRPDVLHCYLRYTEINQYLDYLERRFPQFVTVITIGLSYEGREIKAILVSAMKNRCYKPIRKPTRSKLSTPPPPPMPSPASSQIQVEAIASASKKNNKSTSDFARPLSSVEHSRISTATPDALYETQMPSNTAIPSPSSTLTHDPKRNIVFIEGGTHAREWTTISVALHCVYQLTEKSACNRELLKRMRFWIVPLVNPDGYEYTWSTDSRWRKNRRPHDKANLIGTDCNRNYDIQWEKGPESNQNTYKGEQPFSEPETCAVRNLLQRTGSEILLFLSLHASSQSIMYPWGHSTRLPESWPQLRSIALAGRDAIRAFGGRTYRTGNIATLTKNPVSGSIVDYAFGVIKAPFALVMELSGPDLGFQPRPHNIPIICSESWQGIQQMCKTAYEMMPVASEETKKEISTQRLQSLQSMQSLNPLQPVVASRKNRLTKNRKKLRIKKRKSIRGRTLIKEVTSVA